MSSYNALNEDLSDTLNSSQTSNVSQSEALHRSSSTDSLDIEDLSDNESRHRVKYTGPAAIQGKGGFQDIAHNRPAISSNDSDLTGDARVQRSSSNWSTNSGKASSTVRFEDDSDSFDSANQGNNHESGIKSNKGVSLHQSPTKFLNHAKDEVVIEDLRSIFNKNLLNDNGSDKM